MNRKKIIYAGITILITAGVICGWLFGSVKSVETVQAVRGSLIK